MRIFAHRGASADAPENTLAAFLLAAEQGADGIELDVRLTDDQQLLIVHDPISGTRADYPSQPTLDEVFATIREHFTCINVELKESDNGLEPLVLECIARHKIAERILISSFLPEALRSCTGLLCARLFAQTIPDDWAVWPVLHPHLSLVTEETMALWQGAGKQVNVWTVNAPDEMRRLAALGVDGIITDRPAWVRQLFAEASCS
ncbi:glycerophosphodiester phosphodiesterase [Armatimonas sp.]|uniref:glycerophosphodiester phosphodiesterase n=1 Tax=Armatimonas sp. TaxID=1872638 RepID=UPI00286AD368|nr:glycerophosphodiester phosphodiesterase [Armatimonas sp.]